MEDKPFEQSEFNDALGRLNRMNGAFQDCYAAKQIMNSEVWVQALSMLYSELATAMTDDERKDKQKDVLDLISKSNMQSIELKARGISGIYPGLYCELLRFELFIRDVYKRAGLEGKVKEYAGGVLK